MLPSLVAPSTHRGAARPVSNRGDQGLKQRVVTRRWLTAGCLAAAILAVQPASVHAEQRSAPTPGPAERPAQAPSESGDHGGVTPAQRARMASEEPLVQAALRIRRAAQATKASGFAGVALREGTVTVYWKGPVPPGSRKTIDQEAAKVPVAIRPAAHSAQELSRAADEIGRKLRAAGDRSVVSIGYPVTGAGITATVAGTKTPAVLANAPVPVTLARTATKIVKPASESTVPRPRAGSLAVPGTARTTGTGDPMGTLALGNWPNPSRQDDAVPAWGGAHVINSDATGGNHGWKTRAAGTNEVIDVDNRYHCTSSFPVLFGTQELMVGALSCGGPHRTFVDPSGDVVNTPTTGIGVDASSGVSLTIPKGGAEPYLYTDDPWGQTGWQIGGWEAPVAGQTVCISGAERGVFCEAEIDDEVGTETAYIPTSQGDSNETHNMTNISTHYHGGPVWDGRRPFKLADGSECNAYEYLKEVDELGCSPVPLGPGDMGAAVFTLTAGTTTGVTIKGILVHQHDGDGQNPYGYHMVGSDRIAAVYDVAPLTSRNDRP